MQLNKSQVFSFAVLAIAFGCMAATIPAHAAGRDKLLYRFVGPTEQVVWPQGQLTADAAGNFYGSADNPISPGLVYELVKGANGQWSDKVLYAFSGSGDGSGVNPGFVIDAAGNLYGTTNSGGAYGAGSVFELSPNPDGTWSKTTLYSFNPYNNHEAESSPRPLSSPTRPETCTAASMFGGNFADPYCAAGCGAIFKMTHNPDGTWTESTLYGLLYIDGYEIFSNLNFDAAGNLYGMATWGGTGLLSAGRRQLWLRHYFPARGPT